MLVASNTQQYPSALHKSVDQGPIQDQGFVQKRRGRPTRPRKHHAFDMAAGAAGM